MRDLARHPSRCYHGWPSWMVLDFLTRPSVHSEVQSQGSDGRAVSFTLYALVASPPTPSSPQPKAILRIDHLKEYKLVVNFRRWIGRTVFALIIGAVSSAIGSVL